MPLRNTVLRQYVCVEEAAHGLTSAILCIIVGLSLARCCTSIRVEWLAIIKEFVCNVGIAGGRGVYRTTTDKATGVTWYIVDTLSIVAIRPRVHYREVGGDLASVGSCLRAKRSSPVTALDVCG